MIKMINDDLNDPKKNNQRSYKQPFFHGKSIPQQGAIKQ